MSSTDRVEGLLKCDCSEIGDTGETAPLIKVPDSLLTEDAVGRLLMVLLAADGLRNPDGPIASVGLRYGTYCKGGGTSSSGLRYGMYWKVAGGSSTGLRHGLYLFGIGASTDGRLCGGGSSGIIGLSAGVAVGFGNPGVFPPPTGFLGIVDNRRRLRSGCEPNLSSIVQSDHDIPFGESC